MCDSREFCRSSRDSTIGINFDALGDVEHFEHLSGDLYDLYKSGENTDVTFEVVGKQFRAHKIILASRCPYFKILLFGRMKEAGLGPNSEIPFNDTTPEAFGTLLEYIYSGKVVLGDLNEDVVLHLLGLANKYDFSPLQQTVTAYLKATLTVTNVCLVFNVANYYQLKELSGACAVFIDMHAPEVLKSEGFLLLSHSALSELLERDSFFAPELDIYRGLLKWMEHHKESGTDFKDLLKLIRLQLLPMTSLLQDVRGSGHFSSDLILDAICVMDKGDATELRYRGMLVPDVNVATPHRNACTIEGAVRDALLNGDTENYTGDNGYTIHSITKDNSKGITVRLNQPYLINCIRMLLWDKDNRSYSYFVQVSLDCQHWVTVVNRSEHLCRSWQELPFKTRVIQFIRVVGVHNTMNKSFHLVSFACLHSSKPFQVSDDNLIIPTENVASIAASATVLEGVSRSRNALLNGNTRDYDWDSGYTCHQLGSGCIMIQLAQPYVISSMRLLLWDCDDRTYSYYIEVSNDQKHWSKVVDKSNEPCRSFELIQFEAQVVTFIKLVGTHNTANEVFHVVHFECPASTLSLVKSST